MPHLRILDLPGRESFDLDVSAGGVVGRDAQANFTIEHPTVSRQHAQLHRNAAALVLVDLNSANGTKVNGVKIQTPTTLRDGDSIEFGRVHTLYYLVNAPTQLQAVRSAEQQSLTQLNDTQNPSPKTVDVGSLSLDQLEELLSGLLGLLSKPRPAAQRAQRIGEMFSALMPHLTQAALLDPCGKLIGGIPNGRYFAPDFYGAIAGAYAMNTGTLALSGAAISGMQRQLKLDRVPEALVCLALESQSFKGGSLYLESNRAFFFGEMVDTLRIAARLLGPLLDRAPEDAGLLITNDDLRLAQRIQRKLLPAPLKVPGYQIAAQYLPHYVIGGDFYDVRMAKKNEIALVIGDVSGKGASASLYMSQIMSLCRMLLPQADSPSAFLTQINQLLGEVLEPGVFATMAVVFLQADKGQCRLALAGHNPPLLRTKGGRVVDLGFDPGTPLGASNKLDCKEQRILLGKGDAIILTSDGVEEAENARSELFGSDRRNAALERMPGADNMAIGLREAVFSFTGEERSSDDLTILVVEREA
jgi:hypothetical protein